MQNHYFRVWVYENVKPNIFHFFSTSAVIPFFEKTRVKFSHQNYGLFIHKYIENVKRLFANSFFLKLRYEHDCIFLLQVFFIVLFEVSTTGDKPLLKTTTKKTVLIHGITHKRSHGTTL